ncbi:hypothetical protein D3C87_2203210 [compost metagenome]
MGVAPRGRAMRRPRGVKQNTWSWNSSSLVYSRKSSLEIPEVRWLMVWRNEP